MNQVVCNRYNRSWSFEAESGVCVTCAVERPLHMEQMASASSSVFFLTCSSCAAWINGSSVSFAPHIMRFLSLSHSSSWLTLYLNTHTNINTCSGDKMTGNKLKYGWQLNADLTVHTNVIYLKIEVGKIFSFERSLLCTPRWQKYSKTVLLWNIITN